MYGTACMATLSHVLNSHAYTVLLLAFDRARQRPKDSGSRSMHATLRESWRLQWYVSVEAHAPNKPSRNCLVPHQKFTGYRPT
jgi:hypothetical protein